MAYKLRDMQNIGTSWLFVAVYMVSLLGSTIVNFVAAVEPHCTNHKLLAGGLLIFVILQSITVIMLFTVRQNSLDNYKKLPIWFLTFGSLFQLIMLVLLVYQNIYLAKTEVTDIPEDWSRYIKIAYCVGLCGPILNWIFIFFLITRLNEKIRNSVNPAFLETEDAENVDDNDM